MGNVFKVLGGWFFIVVVVAVVELLFLKRRDTEVSVFLPNRGNKENGVRGSAMAEPGERYYSIEKERVVVVVEGGKRRRRRRRKGRRRWQCE